MTVDLIQSKFSRTYRKLTAIWTIAIIGFGMMISGLLESGGGAASSSTVGNFTATDPYDFPMKETATGIYTDHGVLTETAGSAGIPIFGEWLAAFLFIGGFITVIAVAYLDYTRVHPEE